MTRATLRIYRTDFRSLDEMGAAERAYRHFGIRTEGRQHRINIRKVHAINEKIWGGKA